MKILVVEYICAGGLADEASSAALLAEGRLMLTALVTELSALADIEMLIPVHAQVADYCRDLVLAANSEVYQLPAGQQIMTSLPELITACDAVWPVAPETGGILAGIAQMTSDLGKILLLSTPSAVALCSDKWLTYQHLMAHGVPVVASRLLSDITELSAPSVIKPLDGVGCQGSRLLQNPAEFQQVLGELSAGPQYIIQPYHVGRSLSLSALFKQGQGWLLCCNQQQVQIIDQQFVLNGCVVNINSEHQAVFQDLITQIAQAIPDLWGYIGIDIIETAEDGPLVLEINPRLTTSYVGIVTAIGMNVAEQVLKLLAGLPELAFNFSRVVNVSILKIN